MALLEVRYEEENWDFITAGVLLFFCGFCQAGITCMAPSTLRINLPSTIDWQKESNPEGMISSGWHQVRSSNIATCNGFGSWKLTHNASQPGLGDFYHDGENYKMYATPVEGVAYIMQIQMISGAWWPVQGADAVSSQSGASWFDKRVELGVRIRLVATSGVKPGGYTIPPFDVMNTVLKTNTGDIPMGITSSSGTSVTVKAKSCTLTTPGTVKLPSTNFSQFKSVGDTAGDTSFNVVLKCSDSFSSYSVSSFMTDANDATRIASTLLSPAGSGYAQGIAVQIVDGVDPVIVAPYAITKLALGTVSSGGGSLARQFTARYARTSAVMSPGVLSSAVTITLLYD